MDHKLAKNNRQEYLDRLKLAVQDMHKCGATYRRTVAVNESIKGNLVWKGEVEVFWLTGHPLAKRCYAWSHRDGVDDHPERFVAVLEIPPVIGPATAVRVAIARKEKKQERT